MESDRLCCPLASDLSPLSLTALSAPALMSTAPVVELTLTVTPVGVVNMCRGPDVLDTHFTVSGAVVGDGVRVDDGVEPVG